MMKLVISLVVFLSVFLPHAVHAFPEMVRYGYVNCNSCHVSLTGAGVLNDYGREIAREKLALFKSDDEKSKEQLFAYGALSDTSIEKYLKLGGDVRSVYYYQNTDSVINANTIFMQGDLEGAFVKDKLTIDGTLGLEQLAPGQNLTFLSRRHYVQYAFTDEYNIRVGKYAPAYGIRNTEHPFITRDPLQFGDNFESYNLELSYITDKWNVFLTGVFGRFDSKQADQDRGGTAQVAFAPTEKLKVGLNGWYGQQESGNKRWVMGTFGTLGLTPKIYLGSEIDFQFLSPGASLPSRNGIASTQKLSYELLEGLWIALVQEYGKFDFSQSITQADNYGIEVQIYPRSHFEFNIAAETERMPGGDPNFGNYFWFASHFYL